MQTAWKIRELLTRRISEVTIRGANESDLIAVLAGTVKPDGIRKRPDSSIAVGTTIDELDNPGPYGSYTLSGDLTPENGLNDESARRDSLVRQALAAMMINPDATIAVADQVHVN
jgi:hypothetical protein